jgi:DnaJ-class molecular chaperone
LSQDTSRKVDPRLEEACPDCDGTGYLIDRRQDCEWCGSTGLVLTHQAILDDIALEEEHRTDG